MEINVLGLFPQGIGLFHLMLSIKDRPRLSTISDMEGRRNYVPYGDTKAESRLRKLETYSFY
jgi:hypothetical protein